MMQALTWTSLAPGIWRARLGAPTSVTPMTLAAAPPALDSLTSLPDTPMPEFSFSPCARTDDNRIVIRFSLTEMEDLYGLGLQMTSVNHRGRTRSLSVNSYPTADSGANVAPVPFLVSSRGYGVAVDSLQPATFYCGCTQPTELPLYPKHRATTPNWTPDVPFHCWEAVIPGNSADLYFFSGPSMLDAVRRYILYAGGGALPPRWGLGFWHRVPMVYSDQEALAEMAEIRAHQIPCDVIGLEPGWQTFSYPCSYAWDPGRFPDPAGFVQAAADKGFHINLWEHGYVAPCCEFYETVRPHLSDYANWSGELPDYTQPAVLTAMQNQHRRDHLSIGISGYKIDECDASLPSHAHFPSGLDGVQMNQILGMLLTKNQDALFREKNTRTYSMVRAGNLGGCGYPFAFYSDRTDLREYVRMLCNSGFSGLLWSPEVCGASSGEEWVRRMQVSAFSLHTQLNAWASGVKPWDFEDVAPIVRNLLALHMRLVPYLYNTLADFHFAGKPPIRAMALEFSERSCASLDDQYMLGDALLVAPLFPGESSRRVYLPEGDWYALDTHEYYAGGQWHDLYLPISRLPVFVRSGAILPLMPAYDHVPAAGISIPLELVCFGAEDTSLVLYDDDGETFGYETGEYGYLYLEATRVDGRMTGHLTADTRKVQTYEISNWIFVE